MEIRNDRALARRGWRLALRLLFAAWVVGGLAVGATLMISHWVALPRPAVASPVLAGAVARAARPGDAGHWTATHILYTSCRCSQRILDHLVARRPLPAVVERVVLVGAPGTHAARVRDAGYEVDVVKVADLSRRYGVQAAPLLVVSDPLGQVRYSAGYTDRQQGPDIRDQAIITALTTNRTATPLAVYGCATSRALQQALDPLGLKYRESEE